MLLYMGLAVWDTAVWEACSNPSNLILKAEYWYRHCCQEKAFDREEASTGITVYKII